MSANTPPPSVPATPNIIYDNCDFLGRGLYEIATIIYEPWKTDKGARTYKNIFVGLGILFAIDTSRNILRNFIHQQQKPINEWILAFIPQLNPFTQISNGYRLAHSTCFSIHEFITNIFKKKNNNLLEDVEKPTTLTIPMKINNTLVSNIISYIENDENHVQHEITISNELETDENNKIVHATTYNNIVMQYGGFDIKVNSMMMRDGKLVGMDEICITDEMIDEIDGMRNKNGKCEVIRHNGQITVKAGYYGCQLITLNKIVEQCDNGHPPEHTFPIPLMLFILNITKYEDIELLSQKYLNNVYAFSVVICAEKTPFAKYNNKTVEFLNKHYDAKKYAMSQYSSIRSQMEHSIEQIFNSTFSYADLLKTKLGKHIDKFITQSNNITNNINTLNFHVIPRTVSATKNETIKQFKDFIKHVQTVSKIQSNNSTVKVYSLHFTTKEQPNPEYTQWKAQKEKLEADKTPYKEIIELLGKEPPHTISENNKQAKELIITHKCDRQYSFYNLYLQNNQDIELFKIIKNFKENKARMKELGQQNKLCLLLHGLAGTGKTTTISAIASEFGRDVFTFNISNCNDDDFKNAFEYVNVKHAGGGIIVIEDIDAQTNAVLSRSIDANNEDGNKNVTKAMILNVLDGLLSFDESVVILTTNHPENLSDALMRDGRINYKIQMGLCDYCQIKKMFKRYTGRDIGNETLFRIKEYKHIPATIIERLKEFCSYDKVNERDEIIMKPFLQKDLKRCGEAITDDELSYGGNTDE
jgi:ATP-dependent 26S proteasome regulatory subunit